MNPPETIRATVFFRGARRVERDAPSEEPQTSAGRVPRVARLLALAIRFEELAHTGKVADYAEIARLGHVTRARISQIMSLLDLAPDIQEEILFLPDSKAGRDAITERTLRPLVAESDWRRQRQMWAQIRRTAAH